MPDINTKKIIGIAVAVLSLIVAVVALLYQRQSTLHDKGGYLTAFVGNQPLNKNDVRTIVICCDGNNLDISQLSVIPELSNMSEYSIRDFLLEFKIKNGGINFTLSPYYDEYVSGKQTTYRYKDNTLYSHHNAETPFLTCGITGDFGESIMDISATYDGAKTPFTFSLDILFLKVPQTQGMTYEMWKNSCQSAINKNVKSTIVDIYYVGAGRTEHETNILLSSLAEQKSEKHQVNNSLSATNTSTTITKVNTEKPPKDNTLEHSKSKEGTSKKGIGLLISATYDSVKHIQTIKYKPAQYQRNLAILSIYDNGQPVITDIISPAGEDEFFFNSSLQVISVIEESKEGLIAITKNDKTINKPLITNKSNKDIIIKIQYKDKASSQIRILKSSINGNSVHLDENFESVNSISTYVIDKDILKQISNPNPFDPLDGSIIGICIFILLFCFQCGLLLFLGVITILSISTYKEQKWNITRTIQELATMVKGNILIAKIWFVISLLLLLLIITLIIYLVIKLLIVIL